jgi:GNAT superfamily N-acetyltransferase
MPTDKSGIHIRKARLKDLPAVLDVYAGALGDGQSLTEAQAKRIFRRMKSYPDYHVYVAVENRQVVGTFALLVMDNLAKRGTPSGIVEDVAVLPEWQGRGIGKQMMRFAQDVCRKAGCYKMVLSSNTRRTSAHRFYQSLGFQKHGYSFRIDIE